MKYLQDMKKIIITSLLTVVCSLISAQMYAQNFNYDESKVPKYSLPQVLKAEGGKMITTREEWEKIRRPELLALFEEHVYGKTKAEPRALRYTITSVDKHALRGKATRKEVSIVLSDHKQARQLHVLLYLPNKNNNVPVPAFVGLNFAGNQAICPDTCITITPYWTRYAGQVGFDSEGFAGDDSRGRYEGRWPVETIIARGYAVVTAYYGDLQSDRKDVNSLDDNFYRWYPSKEKMAPDSNEWGAIGIWAWGLSRILDYLEHDVDVDAGHVAVIGHSRLGKTALWAAAQDPRFAMAISNDSGEGGAAITRRKFGETIARINTRYPYWFNTNFEKYNGKEEQLPVDFHQLMALIAPRPLYVASSSEDLWADPLGEYLSIYHAGPAYQLYGYPVFDSPVPPPVGVPVHLGVLGYHNKRGKHDITRYDWDQYLNFADKHLKTLKK